MVRNQTKVCPGKKFVTNEYPCIAHRGRIIANIHKLHVIIKVYERHRNAFINITLQQLEIHNTS